jgi:hypothetical protein
LIVEFQQTVNPNSYFKTIISKQKYHQKNPPKRSSPTAREMLLKLNPQQHHRKKMLDHQEPNHPAKERQLEGVVQKGGAQQEMAQVQKVEEKEQRLLELKEGQKVKMVLQPVLQKEVILQQQEVGMQLLLEQTVPVVGKIRKVRTICKFLVGVRIVLVM